MRTQALTGDERPVLPVADAAGMLQLAGLIVATIGLPPLAHMTGLPVRWLLPMHWPVILAALAYGWRGGAVVGVAAPVLSWLLSGYPLPPKVFPMTVELMSYGLIIGWVRERLRWSGVSATAAGLLAGRAVFLFVLLSTGGNELPIVPYLRAAMAPGVAAAIGQIALLPPLARWWVRSAKGGPRGYPST